MKVRFKDYRKPRLLTALLPPYIDGATGEARTLTGISQRNLNPLRLPIPPQSHLVLPLGIEPREKRV